MFSAIARKSVTDLTRRKARALFTVLTLALAVASVGIFAVPALMQRSMEREVARNQQPDVTVSMKPLRAQRRAARRARAPAQRRRRRAAQPVRHPRLGRASAASAAIVVGVPDYARQRADVVFVDSGSAPRAGTLLTDRGNASRKDFARRRRAAARAPTATTQHAPDHRRRSQPDRRRG